jgi:hypothetical protein
VSRAGRERVVRVVETPWEGFVSMGYRSSVSRVMIVVSLKIQRGLQRGGGMQSLQ